MEIARLCVLDAMLALAAVPDGESTAIDLAPERETVRTVLGYLVSAYNWQTAADIQIVGFSAIAAVISLAIKPETMSSRATQRQAAATAAPAQLQRT